jgi:hypothetical protein
MIEFHTRFNNAVAVEAPHGLRTRIQNRGRGWLYEIGNSFNVDFELVQEGVVVVRGPASGIEDAKKAFMSHFGDVKRKVWLYQVFSYHWKTDEPDNSTKQSVHTKYGTNSFARTNDMSIEPFGPNSSA